MKSRRKYTIKAQNVSKATNILMVDRETPTIPVDQQVVSTFFLDENDDNDGGVFDVRNKMHDKTIIQNDTAAAGSESKSFIEKVQVNCLCVCVFYIFHMLYSLFDAIIFYQHVLTMKINATFKYVCIHPA